MKKGNNWVDFKEVKERVTMKMVLDHYGLFTDFKKSGANLVSCCPIHKGSNPKQFSVDPERNIFNCFGNCKSGGNVLDFVAKMESVSLREAALKLKSWFLDGSFKKTDSPVLDKTEKSETEALRGPQPEIINPPLKFKLKSLKSEHQFFTEHKIRQATVKHFNLGLCSKGIMRDRIVIPIHDEKGQLTAYCGRAINDEQIAKEGKYKLPKNFVKSAAVYNLHRQKEGENQFILVESFLSVYRLYQAGYANVLALMGSSLSKQQEELIVKRLDQDGQVILLFDNDESGQACTKECLNRLSRKLFIKALDISPYGQKPHQLTTSQLTNLI